MDAKQFLAEFKHIASAPSGVARLRQMIYQLAVTGALSARGAGQYSADSLLTEIGRTRLRLIQEKKYKRILEFESGPIRQPPGIDLPPSWRWTRLLDIGEINPRNDARDDELTAFLPMSGVPQLHRGEVLVETRK
jgi:type I restriction enzyme, S subunit